MPGPAGGMWTTARPTPRSIRRSGRSSSMTICPCLLLKRIERGNAIRPRTFVPGAYELVEKPLRAFPPVFAVCCAHNLFAIGEQIPHLQPEKCFRPRTRRGRKRIAHLQYKCNSIVFKKSVTHSEKSPRIVFADNNKRRERYEPLQTS